MFKMVAETKRFQQILLCLLPLVLFPGAGSELYRGLGAVLLGGMLVSTLVTLVLVPVLLGICFRVFPVH